MHGIDFHALCLSAKHLLTRTLHTHTFCTAIKAKKEQSKQHFFTTQLLSGDRKSKSIDPSSSAPGAPSSKISLLNASPAAIAETNWKFVNELLKECKTKTKRILLEKLGQEAVQWGHGDITFTGNFHESQMHFGYVDN